MKVSIMEIKDFKKVIIKSELLNMGKEALLLLTIVEFVFSECILDLMSQLDDEFDSSVGRPCYPSCYVVGDFIVLF